MSRPVKTQWDFGELFPVEQPRKELTPTEQTPKEQAPKEQAPKEQTRKVLSVTELTAQIRRLLEKQVGRVWVTGEITNLKVQGSGHIYFTLKDAGSQLSCVLFRGEVQVDRGLLQDGRKVTVGGEITVYEPRGAYQLRVTAVELQGVGALQAAFEKLKQKLKAEGLFATERKRPLPRYPQRIGLVTSPTGAAIRDVLHVIERRNPGLEIILAPCRVQGDGAAGEIAWAIRLLNEWHRKQQHQTPTTKHQSSVSVASEQGSREEGSAAAQRLLTSSPAGLALILVTRGGGSLEDLWAFNEEVVARAIFESALPVVSAIGHEIDFTISDFVADVRAATPSAAAEIITEGVFASCQFVTEAGNRMRQLVGQQFADKGAALMQTGQRLARMHPRRRMDDWLQRLDDLQTSLLRCVRQGARQQRLVLKNLTERLSRVRPAALLRQRREVFEQAEQRLREQARHRVREWKNRFATVKARLRLLGPEQVLARGYSITMDAKTGTVVREAGEVRAGQGLRTRLKAGEVRSRVEE
jgi:exodeoxyribonuclease VII large subunit